MLRRRNTALQTDTPAFKRWFKDSKVVDAQGQPLVVYHGTTAQFEAFERRPGAHLGFHFGTRASSEDKLRGDIKRWTEGEAWLGTRRGAGPTYLSTDEMRDAAREVYRAEEVRLTAERNRIERGIRERAVPIDLFALVDAHGGDVDAAMEEFHALRETQDAKPTASETRRLAQLEDAQRENEERLAAVFAYRRPGESVLPVYLSIQNPLRMQDTNWGDVSMIKQDHPRLRLQGRTLAEIRSEIERRGYDGIVYENKVEDAGSDSWIAFHPTQIKSATANAGTFDPDDPNMLRNPRRQNPRAWHGSARALQQFRAPAFFADDRKAARWFAVERAGAEPGVLMEVELDIRHPATSADLIRAAKAVGVAVVETPYFEAPEVSRYAPYDGSNPLDLVYIPKVRAELLKRGFDGVRGWDLLEADEIEVWITLRDNQATVVSTHRANPHRRTRR